MHPSLLRHILYQLSSTRSRASLLSIASSTRFSQVYQHARLRDDGVLISALPRRTPQCHTPHAPPETPISPLAFLDAF